MENLIGILKEIDTTTSRKPFSLLEMMYRQVYGKELIQSEMLAGLLRPSENHGHGSELVEHFLRHIGIKVDLQKDSNLTVETERNANGRRIDIFISWCNGDKKHAVIIENKLHNAKNQPNALIDYHKAIEKERYKVEKIVYMPLSKKLQSSKNTDTQNDADVLAKTKDFDAQDIVDWLGIFAEQTTNNQINAVLQYKEFLNCLISNQYIMQQAIEIQEQLPLEQIEKLEKIAEITRTIEWCIVRFRPIVEKIQKGSFEKELQIKYKQNKNYVNHAQFFFDNWGKTFWYEVWLYPEDGIYMYKYYNLTDHTKPEKFGVNEADKLVEFIMPLLQELSNYK